MDTYESAVAQPDEFWRERAANAAEGASGARQFVVEGKDGEWGGSVVVLVEAAGGTDWAGFPVEQDQGHVVGVFVKPEWRGGAVIGALFEAAVGWVEEIGLKRVRLIVHEDNARAQGAYRRAGFEPTGRVIPLAGGGVELEFARELPSAAR
ncbi:GNAT family N-acetyltransferase [Streptomyces sp. 4F14]|uniref:GNAT family N-acetyltransferase n=1 Tax=Streptomyces sp. 4F14 TaxID=3394380 RepID=UPI003A855754